MKLETTYKPCCQDKKYILNYVRENNFKLCDRKILSWMREKLLSCMRDKTSSCVRKNLDFVFASLGQLGSSYPS